MPDPQFRIAGDAGERLAAFRLVYAFYRRSGLIEPNPYKLRVSAQHLLLSTRVIVAVEEHEVVGTMTLIGDCPLGLPLETAFATEVAELRERGKMLGEVSGLAIRSPKRGRSLPLVIGMSQVLCNAAARQGIDNLVIAVHPRHSGFYQRYLRFQAWGGARAYPQVRNHPAIGLLLDFPRLKREHPETYRLLFGGTFAATNLRHQPIRRAEHDFLCAVAEVCGGQSESIVARRWTAESSVMPGGKKAA